MGWKPNEGGANLIQCLKQTIDDNGMISRSGENPKSTCTSPYCTVNDLKNNLSVNLLEVDSLIITVCALEPHFVTRSAVEADR